MGVLTTGFDYPELESVLMALYHVIIILLPNSR
jgi:hypothetical protein